MAPRVALTLQTWQRQSLRTHAHSTLPRLALAAHARQQTGKCSTAPGGQGGASAAQHLDKCIAAAAAAFQGAAEEVRGGASIAEATLSGLNQLSRYSKALGINDTSGCFLVVVSALATLSELGGEEAALKIAINKCRPFLA